MFGMVCARAAQEPRERVVKGVRFRAAYVTEGDALRARLSCRGAARSLARAGVREAVFLAEGAERAAFAKRGVMPISAVPLYCATAAEIVRRYLTQGGMDPRGITLAFAAKRLTPELCGAIGSLASDVRYLVLRVPDGAALARRLQRERGVAVRLCEDGPLRADLTAAFDGADSAGEVLRFDETLRVAYDHPYPNELLAALRRAGALDADQLTVLSVGTAKTQEKSCKTPPFPV